MDFATQSFSVEHILPRAKGGLSELENMALSYQSCNNHKFTKIEGFDPITKQTVPLFHPKVQQWRDHFAWNEDHTIVIGTTPTGRATINELNLNRLGLINLRRVLFASGEHPPPAIRYLSEDNSFKSIESVDDGKFSELELRELAQQCLWRLEEQVNYIRENFDLELPNRVVAPSTSALNPPTVESAADASPDAQTPEDPFFGDLDLSIEDNMLGDMGDALG